MEMISSMTAVLAAIRDQQQPMTCRQVLKLLKDIWDNDRPYMSNEEEVLDERTEVGTAFDRAAMDFETQFNAFTRKVWALSTCTDVARMQRFAKNENTSDPVFATDTEVLEFDSAHRFPGDEYFCVHRWTELYP